MKPSLIPWLLTLCLLTCSLSTQAQSTHLVQKFDIFPFQTQHAHGSTLTELPNGQILAAWFQGSGERQADDVAIMGARFNPETQEWSKPFVMADVPDFPDINPVLFIDPTDQLWLVWYTVLANQWETSLLKYRLSTNYLSPGPPQWKWQEVIHMKPGGKTEQGIQIDDPFVMDMADKFAEYRTYLDTTGAFDQDMEQDIDLRETYDQRVAELQELAYGKDWMARGRGPDSSGQIVRMPMGYPRFRRLGWQTRNRPLFLENGRMLLPLYSDGFDFSIMAITDNLGQTWQFSSPIVGIGPVQPALLQRQDGSILTLMRDNGPPPQRLMQSTSYDDGLHWEPVTDSEIPNPGSAAEMLALQDGRWLLVNNDTEDDRHSLAVYLSEDEGKTWEIWFHLEDKLNCRAHYPAVVQGRDGTLHFTYSYHLQEGEEQRKTIRYARVQIK
jgi:predicted neuraminidase